MASFLNGSSNVNLGNFNESDVKHLVKENSKLQEQLAESREKIQRLSKALSAAHADVSKSVNSVAKYDELQVELAKSKEETSSIRERLERSEEENQNMTTKVTQLESSVEISEKALDSEKTQRKNEVLALKQQLEDMTAKAKKAIENNETLTDQLKAAKEKVQTLDKAYVEAKRWEQKQQRDVTRLTNEKNHVTRRNEQFRALVVDNEKKLKQQQAQISSLTAEKKDFEKQISTISAQKKEVQKSNDLLKNSMREKDTNIESLRSTIGRMEGSRVKQASELERLASGLSEMTERKDRALSEVACLNNWLEQTRENMAENDGNAKEQIASIEATKQDLLKQNIELETKLQVATSELDTAQTKVSELHNTVQQLEEKVKEEKEKLSAVAGPERSELLSVGKIETYTESYF